MTNSKKHLSRWLLQIVALLPIIWFVGFIPLHISLNGHYTALFNAGRDVLQKSLKYDDVAQILISRDNEITVIRPHGIHQLTGSFDWRFFQWGMELGTNITPGLHRLSKIGIPWSVARAIDPSNPTAFFIFLSIVPLSVLALLGLRKRNETVKSISEYSVFFDEPRSVNLYAGAGYFLGLLLAFCAREATYLSYLSLNTISRLVIELVFYSILFVLLSRILSRKVIPLILAFGFAYVFASFVSYLLVAIANANYGNAGQFSLLQVALTFCDGVLFIGGILFALHFYGFHLWSFLVWLTLSGAFRVALHQITWVTELTKVPLLLSNISESFYVGLIPSACLYWGLRLSIRQRILPQTAGSSSMTNQT